MKLCFAAALILLCIAPAHASPRNTHRKPQMASQCVYDNSVHVTCFGTEKRVQRARIALDANGDGAEMIGGRPTGCPHAYCGCGLARFLGLHDARLNLAWNWARLFPPAAAGPGMAVVWRHHVALIERMIGPREAILRDYNSGRGLSRIHARSIAGAVIVNPSQRLAMR